MNKKHESKAQTTNLLNENLFALNEKIIFKSHNNTILTISCFTIIKKLL